MQIPPLFVKERLSIRDKVLQVPDLRKVHGRKVDLVEDSVGEREPDPARCIVGRPQPFLAAAGPSRFESGPAEGFVGRIHERIAVTHYSKPPPACSPTCYNMAESMRDVGINIRHGISFGSALAICISWTAHHSVL